MISPTQCVVIKPDYLNDEATKNVLIQIDEFLSKPWGDEETKRLFEMPEELRHKQNFRNIVMMYRRLGWACHLPNFEWTDKTIIFNNPKDRLWFPFRFAPFWLIKWFYYESPSDW